MENATKALIIAGSILIAILLIAMGMRVFNSTSGTANQIEGTMNMVEIATFNNKFLQYAGSNKSKSDVINLLNTLIAHNSISDRKVDISVSTAILKNDGTITRTLQDYINSFSSFEVSVKFNVSISEYDNGYIKKMYIY